MEKLILAISQDTLWRKWIAANSAEGCISLGKEGCISAGKEGCISLTQVNVVSKSGCIS